jgi:hypothetical protein
MATKVAITEAGNTVAAKALRGTRAVRLALPPEGQGGFRLGQYITLYSPCQKFLPNWSYFSRWRKSPERRFDGFASLVCSKALRMRIILGAFEHQSTKSLSIARLCKWGPTRYGNSDREYPMTFSIAKGGFRHPTRGESGKTFGNQNKYGL